MGKTGSSVINKTGLERVMSKQVTGNVAMTALSEDPFQDQKGFGHWKGTSSHSINLEKATEERRSTSLKQVEEENSYGLANFATKHGSQIQLSPP